MDRQHRRAVIYARVSSERQAEEGWSQEAQVERLREYAARNGLEVVREVVAAESAKASGRRAFQEAVALLSAPMGPRVLLVEKADRATRNLADYLTLDELRQSGVEIHSTREGLVISADCDPSVELMWGLQVQFAKHFVSNLSREVKKGLRQARRDGVWTHRAPVGYVNTRVDGRARLVVDEERRSEVCRIFEAYASGDFSARKLAATTSLTWPSGKPVGQQAIVRMLRHPVYAGLIPTDEGLTPGLHEPLVAPATWHAIQARLDGRNRVKGTPRQRMPYAGGLFTCASCEASIVGGWSKGRSKRYAYLWCRNGCTRSVPMHVVEDQVAGRLDELTLPDEGREAVRNAIQTLAAAESKTVKAELLHLQREQRRLTTRVSTLYEDRLAGRISPERYDELVGAAESSLEETTARVQALGSTDRDWRAVALLAVDLACNVRRVWDESDGFNRREVLETIALNRQIDRDRVALEWAQPFEPMALAARTYQEAGGAIAMGDPRWLSIGVAYRTALLSLNDEAFSSLRRELSA